MFSEKVLSVAATYLLLLRTATLAAILCFCRQFQVAYMMKEEKLGDGQSTQCSQLDLNYLLDLMVYSILCWEQYSCTEKHLWDLKGLKESTIHHY